MSVSTLQAAAMTGPVRRVSERGPRYRIEVRACGLEGRELVTRSFPYWDRATALADFDHQVRLNRLLYSSGRFRLVLIDTEGQR